MIHLEDGSIWLVSPEIQTIFLLKSQVMESIAKSLNFKMDINPPPNGELWGELKNGSFNGLVGELQKENSDVGWADLYMVPER